MREKISNVNHYLLEWARDKSGYSLEDIAKYYGIAIPNVCEEFKVKCTNLEGFMVMENMEY